MKENGLSGKEKMLHDFEELRKDVSNIRTDVAILLNKIDANHKSIRETLIRHEDSIGKHEKTLYGNGNVGITAKVNAITKLAEDFQRHENQDRVTSLSFISILLALMAGMIKLVFFK